MTRARQIANFDPALFAADEVSGDKVSGGTIGAGTIGGSTIVNTSGAITTTGAFTSVGIDDNASGATAITIDPDEKVGIGIAVPGDYELKSGGAVPDLVIGNHSGDHGLSILSSSSGEGRICFGDNDGTGAYHGSINYSQADDGYMEFRTADTVRLKFGGAIGKMYFSSTGVLAGQVNLSRRSSDGLIVTDTSSRRYKENIVDSVVDSSKIHDIVIRDFDWIGEDLHLTGLIAEEVFDILPECVILDQVDGEGPLVPEAINWNTLQTLMLDEMQNMKKENTALKTRLDALEAKVTALESA